MPAISRPRTREDPLTRSQRTWHIHRSHWLHPAVRRGEQLTRGERAADALRNSMGSWWFIFGSLTFLGGWMAGNRNIGFDPYPFILLNLVLSCLAAMQGAILLIAAKRSDQIAADLAQHDYETNVDADMIVKEIRRLVTEIHHHTISAAPPAA